MIICIIRWKYLFIIVLKNYRIITLLVWHHQTFRKLSFHKNQKFKYEINSDHKNRLLISLQINYSLFFSLTRKCAKSTLYQRSMLRVNNLTGSSTNGLIFSLIYFFLFFFSFTVYIFPLSFRRRDCNASWVRAVNCPKIIKIWKCQ